MARLPSGLPSLLKYWSPSFQSVIDLRSMRLHFLRLMQKQHCTGLHNIYHMISHGAYFLHNMSALFVSIDPQTSAGSSSTDQFTQ